jgi:hypothetical protein
MKAKVPQPANDGAGSGRFARVHACPCHGDNRHAVGFDTGVGIKCAGASARGYANSLAEIRKAQNRAEYLAVKWRTDVGIC